MLIEFAVENYRSLRVEQRLSLVASAASEHEETHIVELVDAERVLRAAAVFGPNASGKSNLLAAMAAMRAFVVYGSARGTRGDEIEQAESFGLDEAAAVIPTTFEAVFVAHGIRYQYGFSVTREHVVAEWLYSFPKRRSRLLFARERKNKRYEYEFGETLAGPKKMHSEATRSNALFLSTAVQLNNEALTPIYDWFRETLTYVNSGRPISRLRPNRATLRHCETTEGRERVVRLLREADLGIEDMIIETIEFDDVQLPLFLQGSGVVPEALERFRATVGQTQVRFVHEGASPGSAPLPLDAESLGTQRLFALAGRLLDALEYGKVLVVDELDSSLHPRILRAIVELFVDPETNRSGAQLIFTTHDTNLLDQGLLRRDQYWFTEKGRDGATTLYPLSDFKPRKDVEPLEKNYLKGRYGALPLPRLPRAVTRED